MLYKTSGLCTGDSGAGVWIEGEFEREYKIIAVYAGPGTRHDRPTFDDMCGNIEQECATKLNDDILGWIRSWL